MIFRVLVPLALLSVVAAKRCYECGHMRIDGGEAVQVPNVTFCGGFVDQQSLEVECPKADDCCFAIKEYTNTTDTESGISTLVEFSYHGCFEKAPSQYKLTCENAPADIHSDCHEYDVDTLPDHHLENQYRADVCLCSEDNCNNDTPNTSPKPDTTAKPGDGMECYDCGYMIVGGGNPAAVGDKPFCNDFVDMESLATKCPNKQDCCVILKEFTNTTDTETGVSTLVEFTYHGCFEKTVHTQYDISCETAKPDIHDDCHVFDVDSLPVDHIENVYRAEVCLCNEGRCNNNIPATTQPQTNPTNQSPATTTEPIGPHQQCYNCGYVKVNDGKPTNMPDTAFCNDFIDPDSVTMNCEGEEDCCVVVRNFKLRMNTETKVNDTVLEVRHGCFNMLHIADEHPISCDDAGTDITQDCKVFEDDSLPDSHHEEGVYREEICLCQDPLCNNDVPSTTPAGPTTTTGGGASALSAVAATALTAVFFLLH